jgi:hypothetical protein
VRDVKKKVLGIAVVLMTAAMFVTPVLAIGPGNASGKNPNVSPPMPYGFDMLLDIRGNSHAIVHGWVTITPLPMYELDLDASIFKIKNAFVVTDPIQVLGMENKWLYLSQSVQNDYFIYIGSTPEFAAWVTSFHPEGVYMRCNFLGQ